MWIAKTLEAPTVAKPAPKCGKQPAAKPAAASSSIPVAEGQHVQQFKTRWDLLLLNREVLHCPGSAVGAGG